MSACWSFYNYFNVTLLDMNHHEHFKTDLEGIKILCLYDRVRTAITVSFRWGDLFSWLLYHVPKVLGVSATPSTVTHSLEVFFSIAEIGDFVNTLFQKSRFQAIVFVLLFPSRPKQSRIDAR